MIQDIKDVVFSARLPKLFTPKNGFKEQKLLRYQTFPNGKSEQFD